MLTIENLSISFRIGEAFVPVTRGVSLRLEKGRTLGIVGESGSGKSVTMLAAMGLLPKVSSRVEADTLQFEDKNLLALSESQWRKVRGKEIAMVFQDPMTSLNPLMRCGEQISESLRLHQGKSRSAARTLAVELLERMDIPNPSDRYSNYPFELSGGMRQRVMIAVALACKPKLLIADEPTTALDVTVQAQILKIIRDLQNDFGMSLILITHDLGVVQDMVDELAVLYAGGVVEKGVTREIMRRPSHPYTQGLIDSIPSLEKRVSRLHSIEGVVPAPTEIVAGCRFHPRCHFVEPVCHSRVPELVGKTSQQSACLRREEFLARIPSVSPSPSL